MLSAEDNRLLTETGPDTPMGKLLRRYWTPALLAEELPEPDCPPVRVQLLGENLVAFRDSNNNIGLIDEHCPHRRASMFFGRNEECGLRCVYHGWKFDTGGQCVDMPSEPPESNFKDKVRTKSYPCKEMAGVIWTYMGPPEQMPEPPQYEFLLVPQDHRYFTKRIQESNCFQGLEGVLDSSHISFLHREKSWGNTEATRITHKYTAPKFEVAKEDHGLTIAAKRNTDDPGKVYWRISQFHMPYFLERPPVGNDPNGRLVHCWIPMDDENSMHWTFYWDPLNPIHRKTIDEYIPELIPGTFRTVQNKQNDYLVDRKLQASGRSYIGIKGVVIQDVAVQELDPIVDRSLERLGTSDTAIIVTRRLMLNCARSLENGSPLPGIDPESHRARAASIMLPADVPYQIGAKDAIMVKEGDYVPDPEANR